MGKPSSSTGRRAKTPVVVDAVANGTGTLGAAPAPLAPSSITSFQSAQRYLQERVDIERLRPTPATRDRLKLDRMRKLMKLLGNPQDSIRCVHVAGTKGKGSTCEMAASCLDACGYTVGLYTSPHLVDIRERIRIGRKLISHADFTKLAHKVADAAQRLTRADGEPTFFEILTAMAFLYFADQAVDVAVIECGLGGRLDSTNIITPEVCAVTSISLDHTQLLGETIEKIAREKAGIFKPGVPAVTVEQPPGVLEVFKEVAAAVGAPLQVVGKDIEFSMRFESSGLLGPHTRVCLSSPRSNYEHLPVPLKGEHQAANCGLALAILDRLTERGFEAPENKVTRGLERVECPGRLEIVLGTPRIILDGAHNPASMRCLVRAIGAHVTYDSMVFIFGCAADKDVRAMLQQVDLGADKVIFTRAAGNARAADPRDLARLFTDMSGKMCQTADTLEEALNLARRAVGRDDLICITGSFYLVGEAKKLLKESAPKKA